MNVVEDLRLCDAFAKVQYGDLEASAELWRNQAFERGQTVWSYSEPAEELAVVVDGVLEVFLGETMVGEIQPGTVVGALATFTRGWRTASVIARDDALLLVLERPALERARSEHSAIYDALLEEAMVACARRVRAVDKEIARLAKGTRNAPERRKKGTFQRLVARITGAAAGSAPAAKAVLDLLPVLSEAPAHAVEQVARALEPVFVEKGEPLFLEAEKGDSMYLLAAGKIEVVRNVRGRRGEVLAELFPGAVFGTGALLTRERRGASCVAGAETPVWAYEMKRSRYEGLRGEAGRLWREALLHALWFELSSADERFAELQRDLGALEGAKAGSAARRPDRTLGLPRELGDEA